MDKEKNLRSFLQSIRKKVVREKPFEENNAKLALLVAERKNPLVVRIFGIISIVMSTLLIPSTVLFIIDVISSLQQNGLENNSLVSIVLFSISMVLTVVLLVLFIVLGVRLITNQHKHAARIALFTMLAVVSMALVHMMLSGLDLFALLLVILSIFLIVLASYEDPSLSVERARQRRLRDQQMCEDAKAGTLGLDKTGRGYIALNFFNLFWLFVICCILGMIVETIYHAFVFGGYENRAGLLYGPFSPIYGFGGVLITMALNRFYRSNFIVVFLASGLLGGAFEFFVSWFLEFAFGITAWDYSNDFLNIDGRTSLKFVFMWGLAGTIWVKAFLPKILKIINLIPWNWRYAVTTVCAVLMFINCGLTLVSLDCWYDRLTDNAEAHVAIQTFCDTHYDNVFMENRFQSMSIDPSNATRI